MTVRDAVAFSVREFEGGLSDHPDDRGGLTNAGLTFEVFQEERPRGTRAEFLALSRDEVIDVLTERYALRPGCFRIADPELRHAVIDYAIHSHWFNATKALHRLRLWARLFQRRPSQRAFAAGWLNRLATLLERVA